MTKKTIQMRIPLNAHKKFEEKQERMSKIYERLTGKKKKLPLTRMIEISASQPIYLEDAKLIELFGSKRLGRRI